MWAVCQRRFNNVLRCRGVTIPAGIFQRRTGAVRKRDRTGQIKQHSRPAIRVQPDTAAVAVIEGQCHPVDFSTGVPMPGRRMCHRPAKVFPHGIRVCHQSLNT